MPFVKISDPNIIDLAAWHQVINVVNQHTDSINAITNNFGVKNAGAIEWNADNDVVHEYNPGTEKILYGRIKIDTTSTGTSNINNKQIFYGTVPFVDNYSTAFSGKPIVIATPNSGRTSINTAGSENHNPIVTLFGINQYEFSYRVTRAISTPTTPQILTGNIYISWQAIGPK